MLEGKTVTGDMTLKQWHRTAEMVTNNPKIGWNCESDRENTKEQSKYNSKNTDSNILTWLPPRSIRKMTGFEIHTTKKKRNPHKSASLISIHLAKTEFLYSKLPRPLELKTFPWLGSCIKHVGLCD